MTLADSVDVESPHVREELVEPVIGESGTPRGPAPALYAVHRGVERPEGGWRLAGRQLRQAKDWPDATSDEFG